MLLECLLPWLIGCSTACIFASFEAEMIIRGFQDIHPFKPEVNLKESVLTSQKTSYIFITETAQLLLLLGIKLYARKQILNVITNGVYIYYIMPRSSRVASRVVLSNIVTCM